jgi:hypothetical protein
VDSQPEVIHPDVSANRTNGFAHCIFRPQYATYRKRSRMRGAHPFPDDSHGDPGPHNRHRQVSGAGSAQHSQRRSSHPIVHGKLISLSTKNVRASQASPVLLARTRSRRFPTMTPSYNRHREISSPSGAQDSHQDPKPKKAESLKRYPFGPPHARLSFCGVAHKSLDGRLVVRGPGPLSVTAKLPLKSMGPLIKQSWIRHTRYYEAVRNGAF